VRKQYFCSGARIYLPANGEVFDFGEEGAAFLRRECIEKYMTGVKSQPDEARIKKIAVCGGL
jgi:hypothetical protein